MEYDFVSFVLPVVGSRMLVTNAVVKRVNTSLLLRLQLVAYNIRVHLNRLVKLPYTNMPELPQLMSELPQAAYGAKVTLAF